jgi:ABC-type branched-subunit amino acid transport system permease subunit
MFVLAMSMVGGLGSLWGSLLGAGGLVIAEELLCDFGRLRLVIYGLQHRVEIARALGDRVQAAAAR